MTRGRAICLQQLALLSTWFTNYCCKFWYDSNMQSNILQCICKMQISRLTTSHTGHVNSRPISSFYFLSLSSIFSFYSSAKCESLSIRRDTGIMCCSFPSGVWRISRRLFVESRVILQSDDPLSGGGGPAARNWQGEMSDDKRDGSDNH